MPKLVLYSLDVSPPCRAVLMTGALTGVEFDVRILDPRTGEHLKEDFLKINPQHTIPTLDDNGFYLWDSHAIMCYLVNKYATNDSLYPKDPQKRAVVDQRLQFDGGVLFPTLRNICKPMFFRGEKTIPKEKMDSVVEVYGFLEKFLDGKDWLAGDSYTIADISTVSTLSSLTVFKSLEGYPNISAWLKRCEEQIPSYDSCNAPGNKTFHVSISKIMSG